MAAAQPKRDLIEYVRYDGKANPNKVGRCTEGFWAGGQRRYVGCDSGEVKYVGQTREALPEEDVSAKNWMDSPPSERLVDAESR